jgi:hypothetical protein
MDGKMMTAGRDTVDTALTFQSQTGPDKSSHLDKGTVSQKTLIIVIVVVCGVLFIVIVILIIVSRLMGLSCIFFWGGEIIQHL